METKMQHDALYPEYAVPLRMVGDVRKTYHGKQMYTGTGWVDCDGRTLLTVDYQALFEYLAYTYGGSGGSFNLPDLRDGVGQVHPESALPSRSGPVLWALDTAPPNYTTRLGEHGEYELRCAGRTVGTILFRDDAERIMQALKAAAARAGDA